MFHGGDCSVVPRPPSRRRRGADRGSVAGSASAFGFGLGIAGLGAGSVRGCLVVGRASPFPFFFRGVELCFASVVTQY
jgi:hypothetical protein